jgi:ribosomal protein S12
MATKNDKKEYSDAKVKSDQAVKQRTSRTSRAVLARKYAQEPKKPVSLSPFYSAYLGKVARISLNGISVFVPCNGRTYDVPESFAAELKGRVYRIDQSLNRQKKAADIKFERYAGELKL